jgi:hypothetical protein
VTIFSISELAFVSWSGIALMRIAWLGIRFPAPFSEAGLQWARTHSLEITLDSRLWVAVGEGDIVGLVFVKFHLLLPRDQPRNPDNTYYRMVIIQLHAVFIENYSLFVISIPPDSSLKAS